MIAKSFMYGKNNFSKCKEYLLDQKRIQTGTAKHIAGDSLDFVEKIANISKYKDKYSSMVFSFDVEETRALKMNKFEIQQIIKDLEQHIFCAGGAIPREDIAMSWILHTDKKRSGEEKWDLHCTFAKQFLSTGKYYNPINYGSGNYKYKTPSFLKFKQVTKYVNTKYYLNNPNNKKNKIETIIDKYNPKNKIDKDLYKIVSEINKHPENYQSRKDTIKFLKANNIEILKQYKNGLRIKFENHIRYIKNGAVGQDCLNSVLKLTDKEKNPNLNRNEEMEKCMKIIDGINKDDAERYKNMINKNNKININENINTDKNKGMEIYKSIINKIRQKPYNYGLSVGGGGFSSGDAPAEFIKVWNPDTQSYVLQTNPAWLKWKEIEHQKFLQSLRTESKAEEREKESRKINTNIKPNFVIKPKI